ncbi:MAG: response regulator [Planctomycetota bacterium]|jgi:CheY-like chemotaxis protein
MEARKILIVDDDVDLCGSLKVLCERAGYAAATANSRAEGMEKMTTERPDLLVLDVMMETWHDGFDMARNLKQDPAFSGVPILLLTSVEERTGVEIKSSAGDPRWLPVNGFLDKPVEPDVLLAQIEKLLKSE